MKWYNKYWTDTGMINEDVSHRLYAFMLRRQEYKIGVRNGNDLNEELHNYNIQPYKPECMVRITYTPVKWYWTLWSKMKDLFAEVAYIFMAGVSFGIALSIALFVLNLIVGGK